MLGTTKEKLMETICIDEKKSLGKISIVGVGQVGSACAYSIMQQNICRELVLIGRREENLKGEMMDLQHGLRFVKDTSIRASTDFAASANSNLIIVTAGARQREGESRRDLLLRNVDIFKEIIPKLVKHSPDTILLIVSNPVDVMTYVAWKISGLPHKRVIGSGTSLDTARFHFLIGEKLNVAPTDVHGWIIGEHGDASVPVWSGVNVAGVNLKKLNPQMGTKADPENWNEIHNKVVTSASEVIRLKGYTSWAIGLSVANISQALLKDQMKVQPVSTLVKGFHGIKEDVFLSLPCTLGCHGIQCVISQSLDENEVNKLQSCARIMHDIQQTLVF